jgi:hypothetical protein
MLLICQYHSTLSPILAEPRRLFYICMMVWPKNNMTCVTSDKWTGCTLLEPLSLLVGFCRLFLLITCIYFFSSVLWCPLFSELIQCTARFNFRLFCKEFMLYLCYFYFYTYWCSPYRMMCVSFTLTGRVLPVKQAVFSLPEHRISPLCL